MNTNEVVFGCCILFCNLHLCFLKGLRNKDNANCNSFRLEVCNLIVERQAMHYINTRNAGLIYNSLQLRFE